MKSDISIENIIYRPAYALRRNIDEKSIEVVGLDTEAYTDGKCFMIATSYEDVFFPSQYPACFFSRKYRDVKFVAYNLKYDSGALLQHLPVKILKELQTTGKCTYKEYTYRVIANKMLSIRKSKHSITIYDMLNFYNMSLNEAAKKFLGEEKIDIGIKDFTKQYVYENWSAIARYCIHDAVLVQKLAERIVKQFEEFGVYPRKLYSVAYVSWQYFKNKCVYVHVKKFWNSKRIVLDYAMKSYNGGKFEVTEKGTGYYYEYDIVSAYPYEISNLIDIRYAKTVHSKKYRIDAVYGFLDCTIDIPYEINSPCAMKRGSVNYYPTGTIRRIITLKEYEYFIKHKVNVTINDAYYLMIDKINYPYRTEIHNLMEYKDRYKKEDKKMEYHTVKTFLNAFYGKLIQLVYREGKYHAGTSWNPIYGSIITANTRLRVTELQTKYDSIVAVHTDSVISKKPLPLNCSSELGAWEKSVEGTGIILGCGIYQIGNKSKLRGFEVKTPLRDIIPTKGKIIRISKRRPYTWREVAHRGMERDVINRFTMLNRDLHINFDTKRIWLDDYKDFKELYKRNVESIPWTVELAKL